eukprot:2144869-Pyramimonas_sp.AAC.1
MRNPYRRCVWGCPGARDSLKHYFCWCDPMYMLVRSQVNADLPAPPFLDPLLALGLIRPSPEAFKFTACYFHLYRSAHQESKTRAPPFKDNDARSLARAALQAVEMPLG